MFGGGGTSGGSVRKKMSEGKCPGKNVQALGGNIQGK